MFLRSPAALLCCLLIATVPLTACGGGDDDPTDVFDDEPDDPTPPPTPEPPPPTETEEACVLTPGERVARDFAFTLPVFSAASAWNTPIGGAAVLASSDAQILDAYRQLRGDGSGIPAYGGRIDLDWPFMAFSCGDWSVPIARAGTDTAPVKICNYGGEPDWTNPKMGGHLQAGSVLDVVQPATTARPAGPKGTDSDGHLVLYDPATFIAHDFWQASTQRQSECLSVGGGVPGTTILEAGIVDRFDVREDGTNPSGYFSARAHGTPLLAGIVLPEDIASGSIDHALSFALPGPRNLASDPYEQLASDIFYPAATTEGDFYSTHADAIASGQRIRLKDSLVDEEGRPLDVTTLAPATQMVVKALQEYGAYLVDAAVGFSFASEDVHTGVLDVSMDEVNRLAGEPAGTPLPAGWTKWKRVLEAVALDLERIPIAIGPWESGEDPATAQVTAANFEVVEPFPQPSGSARR